MRITTTIAKVASTLAMALCVVLTVSSPAELPLVGAEMPIEVPMDVHGDGNTWG